MDLAEDRRHRPGGILDSRQERRMSSSGLYSLTSGDCIRADKTFVGDKVGFEDCEAVLRLRRVL